MHVKECFKCGGILPLSDFYKHPKMADGYLNKCKTCNKKDSRKDYNRKIVDPEWKLKERERSRKKMRVARENGLGKIPPEKRKIYSQRYIDKYPEKYLAKMESRGMTPEPCVICGSEENIEGHHEDYSKPKDITWLCRKHHYERHIQIRKEKLLNGSTN